MPGKNRPISTAEKRAMIEDAGEEWPIGSDGIPMSWSASSWHAGGGFWRRRASMARYDKSEKGRTRNQRYNKSEKGRHAHARSNANRIRAGSIYIGYLGKIEINPPAPGGQLNGKTDRP